MRGFIETILGFDLLHHFFTEAFCALIFASTLNSFPAARRSHALESFGLLNGLLDRPARCYLNHHEVNQQNN